MRFITLLLMLFCFSVSTDADEAPHRPPIRIEQAIEKAKKHIQVHEIDVSAKRISSAKLIKNKKEDLGYFWFITWELDAKFDQELKPAGGQVFVSIYPDSRIEVTYGE
ncbi:hypothetical protein QEH52_20040 [Coraliomargarita sp. SDUM461003]|uniref:PepSY domain-containing protein n=1 Tax=Thalassobacterium maritimum TaxID=3041265 RepID=A0ABU1B092_9BACT|nr:hypothetical protein [Coraliomargarita sp. SDUM461003]MDQ8209821.1 hypothetical protein [Coraliomargarita sp. SDUM461003]